MPIHELAAFGAAVTWAFTGLISATPSRHLGAIRFNRTRMLVVATLLLLGATATGRWSGVDTAQLPPIVVSSIVGIFIGDTALFLTMNRLGPRRTAILFAMNAPMSALLGWLVLGETLRPQVAAGVAIALSGVILAIVYGKRPSQLHTWEQVKGPLWIGVSLGLAAALAQALGSLIARPVMAAGADPLAMSAVRMATAAVALSLLPMLPVGLFRQGEPLTGRIFLRTALSGILGLGLGVTLLLFSLQGGKVGVVTTLSAASPALQLPFLWISTGERPAWGAWAGAALVVAGCGLIFTA